MKWAAVTAVEAAPDGSIYVIHRCFANSCTGRSEAPILKYNAAGKLIASFGQGMFNFPHGATVDSQGNLWVSDARGENGKGHQVVKFDPNGKVLMRLGKAGVSGSGPDLFDQPTDVAVAPNGDIFVSDSHRNGKNNRIVKFSKDGKYIKEWGRKGSGRGEISEPHTIAFDSRGRLFVGDRENNRIQIFDQDGKLLDQWRQFGRPSGIFIAKDDTIYVTDSESGPDSGAHELTGIKKGIRIGSAKDGSVTAFIEDMESTTPDHSGVNYQSRESYVDFSHSTPRHVVTVSLGDSWGPVEADIQARWQSSYRDFVAPTMNYLRRYDIAPYTTVNARVAYRLTDTAVVALTAEQLTDEALQEVAGPKVDRRFTLSVTTGF